MRIGVITFPGTIDDRETAAAVTAAGAEPIELWHNEANLARVDAVVLPGGAAHGNYLRPGALAAHAPIMTRVASAARSEEHTSELQSRGHRVCRLLLET